MPASRGPSTWPARAVCRAYRPADRRPSGVPRPAKVTPLVSVIVLNYNGAPWLERCLKSLRQQTIAEQIEVIVADNASPDQSLGLAAELLRGWPNGRLLQHGTNLGYCEGNNRAAEGARGQYLFFLNNDTWLEPDCLERLMQEVEAAGAVAAAPLVLDYLDGAVQSAGDGGFDIFGLVCRRPLEAPGNEIFMARGCSLLIKTDWFEKLGGFDNQFFMYADEYDLCWRLWLAGGKVIVAQAAEVHHRGAAAVNPRGCEKVVEARTSDTKRFYANRNNLLVLLKNCQHLLLLMVPLQLLLLAAEAAVMALLARRWSHVRRAYLEAIWDCWRLRHHILAERRRLRQLRQHGDFWMLRFLRGRLNRWEEVQRFARFGLPKVDAQ
jgi:N-acetylglucosaminyl-diphospho-decaprenol L-rhamnosyltransferase